MTKYLSDKISIVYTILIIMVVYIHSYYMEAEQYVFAKGFQYFVLNICEIANSLFFCISGYLFANSVETWHDAVKKQRKRFRTLFIPFVVWNVIFISWFVILELLPGTGRWVNSSSIITMIQERGVGHFIFYLLTAPAAFHLWFLRDLLVMMLFGPILWYWSKLNWQSALVVALVSPFFYKYLIFFWLGIILSVRKIDFEKYSNQICMYVCMSIFILRAVLGAIEYPINHILGVYINLMGIYAFWYLYDTFSKGRCYADKGYWKYLCGYSFFIYCFHEPTFNIIKKITLAITGNSEISIIINYIVNPWIMIIVAIIVARLLTKFTPPLYRFLTGGR